MVHFMPVFWLGVITLKLWAMFKAGGTYKTKDLMDGLEEALREHNVPHEWSEEIISEMKEKANEKEFTIEAFLASLHEVFDSIKEGTSSAFEEAVDSVKGMSQGLRESLAAQLRKAAEILTRDD